MSVKIERLQNTFVCEISKIIREEIKDSRIGFVTITYVRISSDLSYAKVYFTCLNDEERNDVVKILNNASKFIEKKLCDLVEIRKMPELTFVYDDSIDYGNKIEDIIEKINNE